MKIATVSRKTAPVPRHPPVPANDGQDIPVLGVSLAPRQSPDWPALLREGVEPALMLGAERRLQGRR